MINFNYFIKHVKGRKDLPHTKPLIANRIFYVTFGLKNGFNSVLKPLYMVTNTLQAILNHINTQKNKKFSNEFSILKY